MLLLLTGLSALQRWLLTAEKKSAAVGAQPEEKPVVAEPMHG
jgi:hypothetical protein